MSSYSILQPFPSRSSLRSPARLSRADDPGLYERYFYTRLCFLIVCSESGMAGIIRCGKGVLNLLQLVPDTTAVICLSEAMVEKNDFADGLLG